MAPGIMRLGAADRGPFRRPTSSPSRPDRQLRYPIPRGSALDDGNIRKAACAAPVAAVLRLERLVAAMAWVRCSTGVQSTSSTLGAEAAALRSLTWGRGVAAALITIGVGWIVLHAVRTPAGRLDHKGGMRVILWFGALGPTLLL